MGLLELRLPMSSRCRHCASAAQNAASHQVANQISHSQNTAVRGEIIGEVSI